MTICILTSTYVAPAVGGIEGVIYRLREIFMKHGHRVLIVTADDSEMGDDCSFNIILPSGNACEERNIQFLQNLVVENAVDIIINSSVYINLNQLAAEVRNSTGVKVLTCLHYNPMGYRAGVLDTIAQLLFNGEYGKFLYQLCKTPFRMWRRNNYYAYKYRYIYDNSDCTVLLSSHYKAPFLKAIKENDEKKVASIPNPLPYTNLNPNLNLNPNPNMLSSDTKEKIVVWCGRMSFDMKRPERMIKIWEKVCQDFVRKQNANATKTKTLTCGTKTKRFATKTKTLTFATKTKTMTSFEWKLYMVGDGEMKVPLEDYCKRKGIENVIFTGRANPKPIYDKASILCSTSSSEGLPLVLTEAMQSSVIPCAFHWNDTVYDIIEDGKTGCVIKQGDINAYAKQLAALMSDEERRKEMVANIQGSDVFHKFSEDVIYNQWMELFNLRYENETLRYENENGTSYKNENENEN